MRRRRPAQPLRAAALAAAVLCASTTPALAARVAEVRWAEPFVVRRGETVSLAVVGRRLPPETDVTVLDGRREDRSIQAVGWDRRTGRRARLTLEIAADAPVGLRGLELGLAEGAPLTQTVAFRVAEAVRLPWPHEPPGASPEEQEELRDSVFVVNDFGLYQASSVRSQSYLHDGLDLVLPQGTPLRSLADGIVRDLFLPDHAGSRSIAVEDLDRPGFGWVYVHTDGFRHSVGDLVRRGERIAEIAAFDGLEHLHLSRTFLPEGASWSLLSSHHNHFADDLFEIRDEEPPTIERRLWVFRNQASELLPSAGGRSVASGDVDLVVGIRDGGHYAHSQDPTFLPGVGDRLAPAVVRCEVLDRRGRRVAQWTRDLTRTVLRWEEGQTSIWAPERVAVVYKSHLDVPGAQSGGLFPPYFVLTNADGIHPIGVIRPSDAEHSWRTAATDEAGERLFPDGRYTVRITAWDSVGNRATRSRRVLVRN